MNQQVEANRKLWDIWSRIHADSEFYRVQQFRAGKTSLRHIELQEIGPVADKSLLHLQCHFGQDTLSWARLGALVTGVDFSPVGISQAQSLAAELGIPATFVCAELTELPLVLDRQFDIVFTSYGVLSWLPNLDRWAEVVARYLAPGGIFYMVELHPVLGMFDEAGHSLHYSYFSEPQPLIFEETRSYAGGEAHAPVTIYQWNHNLGDVITALARAGLRIEFVHEFPYTVSSCYPFLVGVGHEKFVMRDHPEGIPLLFSLRATR